MTVGELVAIAFVTIVGVALTGLAVQRVGPRERPLIWLSLVAHLGAAVTQVLLVYVIIGDGDMSTYLREASALASFMSAEPRRFIPEIIKLTFQLDAVLPFEPPGGAPRTRSMYGITSILSFLLADSRWAINMTIGVASHLSKFALYLAFREAVAPRYRRRVAIATMLVPSAVLWSGSLMKEGVAYVGFGWMVWGIWALIERRRTFAGSLAIVLGAIPSALVKPYILFPAVIGAGAWAYTKWRPPRPSPAGALVRIAQTVLVAGAAFGLVIALGELFPRFALDNLVEETTRLQEVGAGQTYGGSQYSLGGASRGPLGQLAVAPLGLLTALYRPLVFEAHNALAFFASLETTLLLGVSLSILVRRGPREVWATIRNNPALAFCLVYTVLFATAVGISSTNMGTLSRYRMPTIPMFATLLAVLLPLAPRVTTRVVSRRGRPRLVDARHRRRLALQARRRRS